MTSLNKRFPDDSLEAGVLAAATLAVEHVVLWPDDWKLSPPGAYSIGTATLGIAFSWWCKRTGNKEALKAWWTITALGGGTVIFCYWIRSRIDAIRQREFTNGQKVQRIEDLTA